MTAAKEILDLNRYRPGQAESFDPALQRELARRAATFGAYSVLVYDKPLRMVRGDGAWMIDADGRRYLDVYNNVPSVGHSHPRVVAAMARQAAALNTNTRYLHDGIHTYAERLLATLPEPISNVVFTCTGSESNDLALRIARTVTGGEGFVVTETAYHGNTAAVTDVSPSSFKNRRVPPHVRMVPAPSARNGRTEGLGEHFAAGIERAIAELERGGIGFAGFMADSIFSSDGIFADPPGFLAPAAALVRRRGGMFIADEVQPGFGRTGQHMWGFERHGVVPDIVTMGKPMGNGFPIGALATRPELLAAFCATIGYFNTFGGNPVAAAAGNAVLDVLRDEGLMANADATGAYLRSGLAGMARDVPAIAAVRGAGLFVGVEFRDPRSDDPAPAVASAVINAMKEEGVLIGAAGSHGNTLKIRPPLCFSRDNADFFLAAMRTVLGRLA